MLTNNLSVLKQAMLSLAVSWTILIAVLCLMKFTDLPSFGVCSADKYVHFTLHFVFTLLWGFYFWLKLDQIIIPKIARVVLLSLCYGVMIEILQEIATKTRHADIFDVLANSAGATIALLFFVLIKKTKFEEK
ncbi:MAG: VanZ family protein [Flavobacteriaceae bacterium]|nr:VanZ family protein [Flavobacteriaceae bacterium]